MHKVMKKISSLSFAAVILMLVSVSCENLLQDPVVENNSAITQESIADLGTAIGTAWSIGEPTNITQSRSGNWDSKGIDNPKVIKINNTFMMWYSGKGVDDKWRIGYATSQDGVNWSQDFRNNPIIVPEDYFVSPDFDGVKLSHVLYDEQYKKFRLWYVGWNNQDPVPVTKPTCNYSLFYAESKSPNTGWYKYPNGDTLTNSTPTPIEHFINSNTSIDIETYLKKGIGSSSVFLERSIDYGVEKTKYRYWVTKLLNDVEPTSDPIVIAGTSAHTPVDWKIQNEIDSSLMDYATRTGNPFFKNGFSMPAVMQDLYEGEGIFKMWFVGRASATTTDGIGLAYAKVGYTFFFCFNPADTENPLLAPGSFSQDSESITSPCVIRDGHSYKMWYVGEDNKNRKTICFKMSE